MTGNGFASVWMNDEHRGIELEFFIETSTDITNRQYFGPQLASIPLVQFSAFLYLGGSTLNYTVQLRQMCKSISFSQLQTFSLLLSVV